MIRPRSRRHRADDLDDRPQHHAPEDEVQGEGEATYGEERLVVLVHDTPCVVGWVQLLRGSWGRPALAAGAASGATRGASSQPETSKTFRGWITPHPSL